MTSPKSAATLRKASARRRQRSTSGLPILGKSLTASQTNTTSMVTRYHDATNDTTLAPRSQTRCTAFASPPRHVVRQIGNDMTMITACWAMTLRRWSCAMTRVCLHYRLQRHRSHITASAQQRSHRPLANPDLFKPTPVSGPQGGPVDEVDALYRNPSPSNPASNTPGKTGGKKWQPLTSVAPNPEPDDHDPFSLGDSDEEEAKTKDIKAEDTERLKKAAEGKEGPSTELKPAGQSGSVGQKDAEAEALLKESK